MTTPIGTLNSHRPVTPGYRRELITLTSLFFMWGLITSLNDILMPHLKAAFELTYTQATLIQFCFFSAYFVMSFPSGTVVRRFGYQRGIVLGLVIAGLGAALFYPASQWHSYGFFLGALFVLASGITLLQVAANPLVALLGTPATASSRLTLTQAFNSLGTTIGPYVGASLILGGTAALTETSRVNLPYLGLAIAFWLLAIVMSLTQLPAEAQAPITTKPSDQSSLLSHRPLLLGIGAIFLYVGGEVSIGSFLVNLFSEADIGALSHEDAGRLMSLYWGGAMVGRFIGSWVMHRVKPSHVLTVNALSAIVLILLAMLLKGHIAMVALLAVGLCNSVMFPTIFSLSIDGLGERVGEGSGLLCMAIVGGAVVPVVMGEMADHIGLLSAFFIPLLCYVYIMYFGTSMNRFSSSPTKA
jgi:FHS family L-fucose permease-like MFS transporter